ncbi:MAG: DUF2497 domain-containing protein [Rickettsiales bacterium]
MAQEKSAAKEQSMEEILQSIKRIIAEENDGSADVAGASDVLELTDLIDESHDHEEKNGAAHAPEPVKDVVKEPVKDVVKEPVKEKAAVAPPPPAPAPKPAPKPEPSLGSSTLVAMPIEKNAGEVPDVLKDIDSLLSDETRKTSSAALKSLSEATRKPAQPQVVSPTPALEFRSGQTVEDLVIEALRPMLKDWLDMNLTGIVEKLVEKEIKKLSS